MSDGRFDIRRAVVAHATRKLVADLDATTANEIRVLKRYGALLQAGNCHRDLPCRSRRIAALNRAIEQRRFRIIQERQVFRASFFSRDSLRKEIWIEGGVRRKR